MRPTTDLDELYADPRGLSFSGRSFVYFYPSSEVNGFAMWGRAEEEDLRRLTHALDAEFRAGTPPHLSFIDFRRVESIDGAAFQILAEYLYRRFEDFSRQVQRQAIVRPAGIAGAIVAGFYDVVEPTYPTKVFATALEAQQWLGSRDTSLVAQIDALVDQAQGIDPIVRLVREALATGLAEASLERVARQLGLSERTLQRRLTEAGTTFQSEFNLAQVRFAQKLLLESDVKLTTVALEVGCASLQHFSALFRRHTGDSPSAWREKNREQSA